VQFLPFGQKLLGDHFGENSMPDFRLSGSPRSVVHFLGTIIICLLCAHAAGLVLRLGFGHDVAHGLVPLFDVDAEGNVPTFFSVCLGLCSAALFALIALDAKNRGDRDAVYWTVLAVGFLFLSYDECFQVHEKMTGPMRAMLGGSDPANGAQLGLMYYSWVVPGLIGAFAASLFFLKFMLRLPAATRRRMILAAGLFLGGCLGMELINGSVMESQGDSLLYNVLVMVEEGLEMAGMATLIYAMTSHIAASCDKFEINLHAAETAMSQQAATVQQVAPVQYT
jgi:hypothetical protein